MNEELPRSKGDALLDRLMQLRMLYEKEHEVYDAAMAWLEARNAHDLNPTHLSGVGLELAEDALEDACRRAKEGHG